MHTDWSSLNLWFFQLWWFWITFNKNPPIHYLNKLEYFIRPIKKKHFYWIVGLLESMLIYCIWTQYLVEAPFALITASIQRGMEVISLWHYWGGMEAQVSLTVAFSSSAFFGLLSLIFLLTIPHKFSMGFRSGEFAGQSSTPTPWSFNQLLVLLAVVGRCQILLENEISIFKKLVSRRKHEVLQNFLVNGCSDVGFQKTQWTNTSRWHCTPNHHRLWKLNTGLQATWTMSFSTLLLLSPGKMPLMTTVAKFLDTTVCGGSWCLYPSLSPFLVKFTQILESILLDNPHKAAVLSVVCGRKRCTTNFPCTQLSVNMLGYSTLWTASFFGSECLWLTLLVSMIVFWTTVRSAVFPMIV